MSHKIKNFCAMIIVAVMFVCLLPTTAYAKTDYKIGVAVVNGSALRLRESNSLFAKVLDYAEKNEIVVVLDKVGDWYKVNYNLQEGYMHKNYLRFIDRENVELGYGSVSGSSVNMRSGPSTKYQSVQRLNDDDSVYIIGINNGWYKVIFNGKIGYIRSDYVELTEIPYENYDSNKDPLFFKNGKLFVNKVDVNLLNSNNRHETGSGDVNLNGNVNVGGNGNINVDNQVGNGNASTNDSAEVAPETTTEFGAQIVELAKQYIGVPYVYGGASPNGFDCSGFAYYIFNKAGYKLSRIMVDQYRAGTPITKEDLQPGDLVFFQNTYKPGMSHVGIYVGNNQFIHAPSTGKTVSYANLNTAYYIEHYYGACRITK